MTTYTKSWTNYVWLVWSAIHLPIILRTFPPPPPIPITPPTQLTPQSAVIDGLDFLPTSLYLPPTSPLHFAHQAKADYNAQWNDPITQWSPATASGHDSWMGLFLTIEFVALLPVLLFTVYRLGIQRRGTSGAHELLLVLYGFEVAFTTLVCINDVFYWDEKTHPTEKKRQLVLQYYLPFFIARKFLVLLEVGGGVC